MSRLQLLLIGFLLLAAGFAGGWATHRSMVVDRMHDVARMRKAGGFEDFLYRRIQATPEQQKKPLTPLCSDTVCGLTACTIVSGPTAVR